jgi:surface antigen
MIFAHRGNGPKYRHFCVTGQIGSSQFVAVWSALMLLTACTQTVTAPPVAAPPPPAFITPTPDAGAYREQPALGLSCVPYARQRSGIALRGDAYAWWEAAAGRYPRGAKPAAGAVLVLNQTDRLRSGHLAVVKTVLGPREILVDHANWIPDEVVTNMPVIDVSPDNDWSLLRFWNAPSRTFGAIYPASGFVYALAENTAPVQPMPDDDGNQPIVISSHGVTVGGP